MEKIVLLCIAFSTILFFISIFVDGLLSEKPDLNCWIGQKLEKIRPYHKKIKTSSYLTVILTIIFCIVWVLIK